MKVKVLSAFLLLLFIPLILWNNRTEKTPGQMARVPAGEFIMGTDETAFSIDPVSALPAAPKFVDAGPTHTVYLDSFYIDLHKVSHGDYQKFSKETRKIADHQPFDLNDPVTGITWQEATDYCRSIGKRLPTEEEWEKASRGTDGRVYPWGNQFDPKIKTASISFDSEKSRSPYGVEKMVGAGWEWTSDWYRPYPNNPYRSNTFWEGYRVIRGGSWRDQPEKMIDLLSRTTTRFYFHPDRQDPSIGFRCAMSARS